MDSGHVPSRLYLCGIHNRMKADFTTSAYQTFTIYAHFHTLYVIFLAEATMLLVQNVGDSVTLQSKVYNNGQTQWFWKFQLKIVCIDEKLFQII